LRRDDARPHLGARVRACRLAARPDSASRPGRAPAVLPERGRGSDVRRPRLRAALDHERGAPLLPHGPPPEVRARTARDLRRARAAGAPDPGGGGRPRARRLPVAGEAVRGARGERSRIVLGERDAAARGRRHGVPRARAGRRGARVPPRAHRVGREPGLDDGGGRGALAARLRRRPRDLPPELAVRNGPVPGAGLQGAEPPRPPGAPRAHARGPPASRHALLPLALRDGPARVLGGPGRRQAARARDRRRASQAHPLLRGAPVTGRERADRRQALRLLAPTLLALGALAVYPGFWVVWLSLQHRVPIFHVARFAGLDNYVFLASDPRFWNAARTTVVFTALSVALELALGVTVALALHRQRRGRRLGLSLLLLAWAMPSVVTAKLYEWLYHPAAGLVSVLLGGHALNWLGDPYLALPAVILADVWRTMPFVAILCYARLVTIPAEVYEAAQVDGAGRLATLGRITLPLLGRIVM